MEVINDLIVLGLAVPEEIKDGRRTVCLGGYSPSRGFIRVYPCRPDMQLHRWDILRVEVERNERDTRHESWKLVGSNPEWETLNKRVQTVGHLKTPAERFSLLNRLVSPCVSGINSNRDSLGIVHAQTIYDAYFSNNPQFAKPRQLPLLERTGEQWVRTKSTYPIEPRLSYSCSPNTCRHDQKLLEWGAFEWMRKQPSNHEQLWENLRLYSPEHEIFLLVGNQAHQRTSFLVINIIPVKSQAARLFGARAAKQARMF